MMQSLLLRREPFGGVLAQRDGEKVKFLNYTGYEITRGIAQGLDDDEIVNDILSKFEVSEIELVRKDISNFRSMISNVDRWPTSRHSLEEDKDRTSFSVPTLSAPLDLHWEITKRCNLYCRHCFNRSSMKMIEPCLEQIRSVINELEAIRLRSIVISGGEPLMRKDLKTILEWVRPMTSIINLSTNATLITDDNSSWFPDLVDCANVSLDAGNKLAYEMFRGRKGSFDRCIRGLRSLIKMDIPVAIQTTISRFNIDYLDELANLIIGEGVTTWIVRLPISSGRAIDNRSDFLSRKEIVEKEQMLSEFRKQYESEFERLSIGVNLMWSYRAPYSRMQNRDRIISCAAGTVLVALLADGKLAPCPLFADTNFKSDVVWNKGFLDQWKSASCLNAMRSLRLRDIQQCFHCAEVEKTCGTGCRAKSYLSGNLLNPDPDCGYLGTVRPP